jgi:glycosyltransferase involved in cell wall biosynthesis
MRGRLLGEVTSHDRARVGALAKASFISRAIRIARRSGGGLVVIATHPHLAPVARACKLVSGAPYVVWCHGIEAWGQPRPEVSKSLRDADIVFAPSNFTARRVEKVAGLDLGSVLVIPHAVSESLERVAPQLEAAGVRPIVLTVARLTRENRYKGIDVLISAWPLVLARNDVDLVVVGDGSDLRRLETLARLLGVTDRVRFAGRLSDDELASAYDRATLFAMPARFRLEPEPEGEGFGLVYVEAGARGIPVVAGTGGGIPDAVHDGVSGLLVDPEDPQAVADGILRILDDPGLAAKLGEGGRELAATTFSFERFRAAVDAMLRGLRPTGAVS